MISSEEVTKELLIVDMRDLCDKYGAVTRNFYRGRGKYSEASWQKFFPTFSSFILASKGLVPCETKAKVVVQPSIETQADVAYLKAKAQGLETALKTYLKEKGNFKSIASEIAAAVVALEPYPRVLNTYDVADANAETPVAAVIKLSDWQIGEVINANETEGFGVYNFAIAEKRIFALVKKVTEWVEMHRKAGYIINELHVFSEGDIVSGNIHYELEVTNEFCVTVAAAKAGMLLAEVIAQLAAHFDKVTVWEMSADNHGRLTRKSQAKQGAANNYGYLSHVICNEVLRDHENVQTMLGEGTKLLANVLGKKFLISHGHHIVSQAGIPYYGLDRDKAREATKRQNTDKTFDYLSLGHFHVPAIISGNILINGCLTGTTEFDHMLGRNCHPAQVSFMTHPVHGIFNWVAWDLT
jgi:hypothetical protein